MLIHKRISTQDLVRMSIFTALIAIGAFIKVPVPAVPFTLQFFFTTLSGALLGANIGAGAVVVYALLGLVGLPIFAQGGGFHYIFNPTFGYIIGFIVATYIVGYFTEKGFAKDIKGSIILNFISLLVVYLFGMVYYYVLGNYVVNSPIGIKALFIYGFLLAVPGDIVLCFIAALVSNRMKKIVRGNYGFK